MRMTKLERSVSYLSAKEGELKVIALVCKESTRGDAGTCVIRLYTPEALLRACKEHGPGIDERADGLHWKCPQVNKTPRDAIGEIRIGHPWNTFDVKNGNMSRDQELTVAAAMNLGAAKIWVEEWKWLNGVVWTHTGDNHRRGNFDIKSKAPDGRTIWIEVKGRNGRLFFS